MLSVVDWLAGTWLGTSRGGANHLYLLAGEIPALRGEPHGTGPERSASMYAGRPATSRSGQEEDGLFRCKLVGDELLHFVTDPVSPTSLASNRVSAIAKDGEGRLWVGPGRRFTG